VIELRLGDCRDTLQELRENSVDAVVCDPPYGLSREPDAAEVLRHWLAGDDYEHSANGFMGKEWDSFVPGPATWREVHRVLKPGGHLVAFAGTRTQDLMGLAIRLAGFEIRDCLAWVHSQGFPKSLNIAKAIDKAAGAKREPPASMCPEQWSGWGTALKPATEPIILARKPLAANNVVGNVMAHGTGGLNIEGCRTRFRDDADEREAKQKNQHASFESRPTLDKTIYGTGWPDGRDYDAPGRWPTNLVLSHSPDCELVGERKMRGAGHFPAARGRGGISTKGHSGQSGLKEKSLTSEVVPEWRCAAGCTVAELERQHPGASRFFPAFAVDPEDAAPIRYVAKPPKRERHAGLELDRGNTHITVKPIALMRWLCRLVCPPGGVVLDPFAGSGTTGCAAVLEGFGFIGCELDEEYLAIARARIAHWAPLADTAVSVEAA
jgi:DNA modification methylase